MFDYNEQILAYETDCVSLPQPVKDKLREHREANRNRLKRNRPEAIRLGEGLMKVFSCSSRLRV
jgi:hypothetical protein